jgi:thiol-disulfide isomerase/thioredoxin
MNRRQWITIIGIGFFALAAGALSAHWFSQSGAVNEEAVKTVFSNEWQSPDGKTINTSAWEGKVLVLNFWASWCPPCVEEMPELDSLQRALADKNVLFVGIAVDSPSNVRDFLKKTPVSYPIVMGGMNASGIYKALGNTQSALPYTVVISSKGKVVNTKLGKIDEDSLRKAINSAL